MSAPVSAALAKTSYASSNWSRVKWWVTNRLGVELVAGQQAQQGRCGGGVDEPGRDRDVADPEVLEVQRHRLAVHADVGDVTAGSGQPHGQLEGGRHADGLDGHVGAEAAGQLGDDRVGILARVVDR